MVAKATSGRHFRNNNFPNHGPRNTLEATNLSRVILAGSQLYNLLENGIGNTRIHGKIFAIGSIQFELGKGFVDIILLRVLAS